MSRALRWLLDSTGLKRQLASLFSVLASLTLTVPQLQPFAPILAKLAAFFGLVGVTQATKEGTIKDAKLGSVASLLAVLIVICGIIPALRPFVPMLQEFASFAGAASLGVAGVYLAGQKSDIKKDIEEMQQQKE